MTTTTAPEISDEELRQHAEEILAEMRKPPADRWYNQSPFEES